MGVVGCNNQDKKMDFHLQYLSPHNLSALDVTWSAPPSDASDDSMAMERIASLSSACSSSTPASRRHSRSQGVPPSPVSVLKDEEDFSRCDTLTSSSAFSSSKSHNNFSLQSIDEDDDGYECPGEDSPAGGRPHRIYSRQSSAVSVSSAASGASSATSVDWLNCYATSVLEPKRVPATFASPAKAHISAAGSHGLSESSSPAGSLSGFSTPSPVHRGHDLTPPRPPGVQRTRKQLAMQLDDLILSMDRKIKTSLAASRTAEEDQNSHGTADCRAKRGSLESSFGMDSEEEEEFAMEEVELGAERGLLRSMESLWSGTFGDDDDDDDCGGRASEPPQTTRTRTRSSRGLDYQENEGKFLSYVSRCPFFVSFRFLVGPVRPKPAAGRVAYDSPHEAFSYDAIRTRALRSTVSLRSFLNPKKNMTSSQTKRGALSMASAKPSISAGFLFSNT